MDEQGLRRDVLMAFDFAHTREDFVNPVEEALAGVTAQEALWRADPGAKGIWDIVLHMSAWTENGIERIRSGQHSRPAEGAWPSPPNPPDEAAWEETKNRLRAALTALRTEVGTLPSAVLVECRIHREGAGWSPLIEILSRFIHNAYHLGQITKLRELRSVSLAS